MKGDWHLVTTDISLMDLKAQGVYLAVSLSGDESNKKQSTPVHKKGTTFEFTVEGAKLLDTRLKFKIEKEDSSGRRTDVVGKADVPVKDLLVNGSAGDMKLKVLSSEGTSSSPKTMAVLEFSYKFGERFPVELPLELEEGTVTANPASYMPPMPRLPMAYQQNAAPNYPAAPPPAVNTGMGYIAYQPTAAPPPAMNTGETVMVYAPVGGPPPPPYPQTAYHHNAAPNYPVAGPPHHQTPYVPNATPTYFYGPSAVYWPAAPLPPPQPPPPRPHPGRNILGMLGIGVAVNMTTDAITDPGFGAGGFFGG